MDFARIIDRYLDQENLNRTEGQAGVRNLAKLVNALGYQDFNRYGQMPGGTSLGDIFAFLEDNSGAIEAIVEWIKERNVPEWKEAIESQLHDDSENDLVADHFKNCPDCGHEIPEGTVRGEECENCGHVFNWGPVDDEINWADQEAERSK